MDEHDGSASGSPSGLWQYWSFAATHCSALAMTAERATSPAGTLPLHPPLLLPLEPLLDPELDPLLDPEPDDDPLLDPELDPLLEPEPDDDPLLDPELDPLLDPLLDPDPLPDPEPDPPPLPPATRVEAFGVPIPVGPSHPVAAVQRIDLLQLPFVPEVTS